MKSKKYIRIIHLWLGLSSGLVVFVVAITGCIYAFQAEIQNLLQPYRFVKASNESFLPPSAIQIIAEAQLPGRHAHSVTYGSKDKAAKVIFYEAEPEFYYGVYINPYSGKVLKVKDFNKDFFRFILDGHFYLWLPPKIGQTVVATATLIFVVMLITGIILWWPKKNARKQRFTIKWNAAWRRKNYDLHSVLGFYASWVVIIIALTGLVWGFEWFKRSVYFVAGGEKSLAYEEPLSDTSKTLTDRSLAAVDVIWQKMKAQHSHAGTIEVHYPESKKSSILANVNPDASTYWKTDYIYFDQYTLKEIRPEHIWSRFETATAADKLMRLNYDIHVGAIWGLPGKTLAFFASLIVASLPVTGFIMWWGRRNKKRKAVRNVADTSLDLRKVRTAVRERRKMVVEE